MQFAEIHDLEVHVIEEKMSSGFHQPWLVPDETDLEDWLEDPEFWEWWMEAVSSGVPVISDFDPARQRICLPVRYPIFRPKRSGTRSPARTSE